jgi:hypothetical protein
MAKNMTPFKHFSIINGEEIKRSISFVHSDDMHVKINCFAAGAAIEQL